MFISVYTLTYNRGYILERMYRSLKDQTDHSFEWIVVDDGSTDNTKELVEGWSAETTEFDIRYEYIPHGGIGRALSKAISMARYEIIMSADSDDRYLPDTIAFVRARFPEIAQDESFAGICGLWQHSDGGLVGGEPPFKDFVDATFWELEYAKYADCIYIYKTSVRRKYPPRIFEGDAHTYLGISENDMAHDGLKMRWFNHIVGVGDYLSDGITRNASENALKSPRGVICYNGQKLRYGLISPETAYRILLGVYLRERENISMPEMQELAGFTDRHVEQLRAIYNRQAEDIAALLKTHNVRTLALYGFGKNAEILREYLSGLDVEICYIIDQNYTDKDFSPGYTLEMELPPVDSICVTPAIPLPEVERRLREKMQDTYIWSLREMKGWIE